jgi:SAM-dependent methyltransferase
MKRAILQEYLKKPQSRFDIITEFCRDKEVLDIGCVQHDVINTDVDGWLHHHVVETSSYTLGVDYLEDEVNELVKRGYNVVHGDVNKPLSIDRTFDVIVVGNLIEHLSNFEGLLNNINRLLKPNGVVLISTANPFYCEQYFYSAFKNDIIINPEHTCWIDPVALDQLSNRFGLYTVGVRWIKESWVMASGIICHGDDNEFDIFTGKWIVKKEASLSERFITNLVKILLSLIWSSEKLARLEKEHGSDADRALWIMIKGRLFGLYWKFRKIFIPASDMNKHELYMSVLKKEETNEIN